MRACVRARIYLCVCMCVVVCVRIDLFVFAFTFTKFDPVRPGRPLRRRSRRPLPQNSDRPPHPVLLSFAFTSAPCVSSAATTSTCPLPAARWSGVYLRWIAHLLTPQAEPVGACEVFACVRARLCVSSCLFATYHKSVSVWIHLHIYI